MNSALPNLAVIGAGISGLVLARELRDVAAVTVFEKSRGPGGRMSTRHQDGIDFDHGAQYFTARGRRFKKYLQPHLTSGAVAIWDARITTLTNGPKHYKRIWFEPHYVGRPGMNGLCRAIGQDADIRTQTEVQPLKGDRAPWDLTDGSGRELGRFDWIISTAPAAQTAALFPPEFGGRARLSAAGMSGCHTLMIRLDTDPAVSWDAAVVKDSFLEWLAFNHRKPGRDATQPTLIVNSTNAWAEETRSARDADIVDAMVRELLAVTGFSRETLTGITLQRWRYAAVDQTSGEDFLLDEERGLAACGDWCMGSRVESAFLSAARLAERLKKIL